MLATPADVEEVTFPVIASPKLDGIRCLKISGKAVSRSFKPISNHFIRTEIEKFLPDGIDGEIMLDGATFSEITSAVATEDGTPNFVYHAFDYVASDNLNRPYKERLKDLEVVCVNIPYVRIVETRLIANLDQLEKYEEECLEKGYEGVMLRSPQGPYKCGRSTLKEQYLLKIKRFDHFEAKIVDFLEQMHNDNEKEENELGLTKRSTSKDGMSPAGTLGKFVVESLAEAVNIKSGDQLKVGSGSGLTKELRQLVWNNKEKFLGKLIRCKYQKVGSKDKPRFITFDGFRDKWDMS